MATEKEITLKFKIEGVGEEVKNIQDFTKAMNDAGKAAEKTKEETTFVDDLKNKFKPLQDGVKKFGATLKATNIFKLLGIGLVITAITSLIAYFKQSEEGSRKLAIAVEAVGIIFGKLVDFAASLGAMLVDVFTKPGEYIKKFGEMVKQNLINRFVGILELLPALGKAIGKLFQGEFAEAGKIAADAVGKVVLGVENVTDVVSDGIDAVVEWGKTIVNETIAAVNAATKLVDAQRALRNLQQALIVENAKLNKELELQQKIAEDTTLSYQERKDALEKVGEAQVKLAENLAAQASAQENLLRLQLAQEGNYEAQEELQTQIAEAVASRIEAETQLELKKQEAAKITRELDLEELDRQRSITQMITDMQNGLVEDQFERARRELQAQEEAAMAELTRLRATEEEKQAIADAYSAKRVQLATEEAKYKSALEQQVKDNQIELAKGALGAISKLVGEGTAVGKAAAIAQTTIDTYASAQAAYKSQLALATPDAPVRAAIAAGIAIANGLANVKAIVSTKTPGTAGGSTGGSPSKPSFKTFNPDLALAGSVAGQSQNNQFGVQQQGTQTVLKAYVVASDVTNQQQADKQINNLSRLGR
jgi:hypothetical protein